MNGPGVPCLYEVLGVKASAGTVQIRSAFKQQALATHPDKGGTKESFQLVVFAFETLQDPTRRAHYDQHVLEVSTSSEKSMHATSTFGGRKARGLHRRTKNTNVPHVAVSESHSDSSACNPDKGSATDDKEARAVCKDACGVPQSAKDGISDNQSRTLQTLFCLLQRLNSEKRREVIIEQFTHSERKQLESWAVVQTKPAKSTKEVQPMHLVKVETCHRHADDESIESDPSEHVQALENGSSDEAADVDGFPLALRDAESAEDESPGVSISRHATCDGAEGIQKYRGIVSKRLKSGIVYYASISVRFVVVRARFTPDLGVALDDLVILTDWARCARQQDGICSG